MSIFKGRGHGHRRDAEGDRSGTTEGANDRTRQTDRLAITADRLAITHLGSGTKLVSGFVDTPTSFSLMVSGGVSFHTKQEPEEEVELEVSTSPVFGYRTWNVGGALGILQSQHGSYRWRPGKNKAECVQALYRVIGSPPPSQHTAPSPACRCGFNAMADIYDLDASETSSSAVGSIVGWGKVVIGARGTRSQYATVAALYQPPKGTPRSLHLDLLRHLASFYSVPLVTTISDLEAETRKLADWMEGRDLIPDERSNHAEDR